MEAHWLLACYSSAAADVTADKGAFSVYEELYKVKQVSFLTKSYLSRPSVLLKDVGNVMHAT